MVAALLFGIAATCLFSACSNDDDTDGGKGDKSKPGFEVADSRTVMVYIAVDNSLSDNGVPDFREVVNGFNKYNFGPNNRVVLFIDTKALARIYVLDSLSRGKGFAELTPVKTYETDVNSASADVFGEFVDYAMEHYPAQSYGLVMGSHGFGWIPSNVRQNPRSRAFGQDVTSGGGRIGMGTDEIADVLKAKGGVDFIFFDACFMQTIEVACDLMDVTKHIVASPAEVPEEGADYSVTLPEMFRKEGYAEGICKTYNDSYKNDTQGGVVISDVVTEGLPQYLAYMSGVLSGKRDVLDWVDADELFTYHEFTDGSSFYPDMPDMKSVMKHLLDDGRYAEWCEQTDKVVKCWHASTWYDGWRKIVSVDADQCSGVSMFVPRSMYEQKSLYFNYYFNQTRWAKTLWGE